MTNTQEPTIGIKNLTAIRASERVICVPEFNWPHVSSATLSTTAFSNTDAAILGKFSGHTSLLTLLKSYYKTKGGEVLLAVEKHHGYTAVETFQFTFQYPCDIDGNAVADGTIHRLNNLKSRLYKQVTINTHFNGFLEDSYVRMPISEV